MKLFWTKIGLFCLLIIILQGFISQTFPSEKSHEVAVLKTLLAQRADIIYLGDSTAIVYDPQDPIQDSIPAMLEKKLPGYRIGALIHPAFQMDVYYEAGRFLRGKQHQPKFLIIPINLRSFAPEWDMRPVFQFQFIKYSLRYDGTLIIPFLPFLVNINALPLLPISEQTFAGVPILDGDTVIGRVNDFENIKYFPFSHENQKNIIYYFYMAYLKPDHRKIRSLVALADLYKASGTQVLFYFTPLDYETAEKYTDAAFRDRIIQKTGLISQLLRERGYDPLDLTFSLPADAFTWGQNRYINEHLKDKGREYIAARISQQVTGKK